MFIFPPTREGGELPKGCTVPCKKVWVRRRSWWWTKDMKDGLGGEQWVMEGLVDGKIEEKVYRRNTRGRGQWETPSVRCQTKNWTNEHWSFSEPYRMRIRDGWIHTEAGSIKKWKRRDKEGYRNLNDHKTRQTRTESTFGKRHTVSIFRLEIYFGADWSWTGHSLIC